MGMPVEETALQVMPFGLALLMALRISARRIAARKSRESTEGDP